MKEEGLRERTDAIVTVDVKFDWLLDFGTMRFERAELVRLSGSHLEQRSHSTSLLSRIWRTLRAASARLVNLKQNSRVSFYVVFFQF